jgi:hypothetical protein
MSRSQHRGINPLGPGVRPPKLAPEEILAREGLQSINDVTTREMARKVVISMFPEYPPQAVQGKGELYLGEEYNPFEQLFEAYKATYVHHYEIQDSFFQAHGTWCLLVNPHVWPGDKETFKVPVLSGGAFASIMSGLFHDDLVEPGNLFYIYEETDLPFRLDWFYTWREKLGRPVKKKLDLSRDEYLYDHEKLEPLVRVILEKVVKVCNKNHTSSLLPAVENGVYLDSYNIKDWGAWNRFTGVFRQLLNEIPEFSKYSGQKWYPHQHWEEIEKRYNTKVSHASYHDVTSSIDSNYRVAGSLVHKALLLLPDFRAQIERNAQKEAFDLTSVLIKAIHDIRASKVFIDYFASEENLKKRPDRHVEAQFLDERVPKFFGSSPIESYYEVLFPQFVPGTKANEQLAAHEKTERDDFLRQVRNLLRQTRTAIVLCDLVKNKNSEYSSEIKIIYNEVSGKEPASWICCDEPRSDYMELELAERSFMKIMDQATEPGTAFMSWLEENKIQDEREILEFWANLWSDLGVTQKMLDEGSEFRKRMIWEIPFMRKDGSMLRQHFEEPEDEWYEGYMMCFLSSFEIDDEEQPFDEYEYLNHIREKSRRRLMAFLLSHLVPGDPFHDQFLDPDG